MSVRESSEIASHGRGGAGNIGADNTAYGDGEIVREGVQGEHGDGAFSTGRGGVANIGSPKVKPTDRKDELAVPEVALRASMDNENYHTGRGGGGNVHLAPATSSHPQGLADKLKDKLFGVFKKGSSKKEPPTS